MKKIDEIQFLRCLAVLSVVFFHLYPKIFSGGFIGVDIFFVISGYLMAKIIKEKKQSLSEFYLARLKRILPCLYTIILLVLIFSFFIFLHSHFILAFKSSVSSLLFFSNIFFWLTTQDYFTVSKIYLPLLHTWSISLELQFYFLLPLIFLLIKNKKNIKFCLILLAIISFLLSYISINKTYAFYLLPFRLHEFLLGSFLFYLPKLKISTYVCDFIFILLVSIIIYFIIFLEPIDFPGVKSFLISFIIFIILYFNNYYYTLLLIRNSLVQFLGKISYSLFLVHWPIIVFFKYFFVRDLYFYEELILLCLVFTLSVCFFFKVENYFRANNLNKKKITEFFLYFTIILIFFLIFVTSYNFQNPRLNNTQKSLIEKINNDSFYQFETIKKYELKNYDFKKKNVLIFGDSHASDIYRSLQLINSNYNYHYVHNDLDCSQILSKNYKSSLIDIIKENLFNKVSSATLLHETCFSQYILLDKLFLNYKFDRILISMKWSDKEIDYLSYIINYFDKKVEEKRSVFFFSKRLEIPDPLRVVLLLGTDATKLNSFFNENKIEYPKLNEKLFSKVTRFNYIDIDKFIKNDSAKFIFYNEQKNKINYVDYSHFSISGGILFVNRILSNNYILP